MSSGERKIPGGLKDERGMYVKLPTASLAGTMPAESPPPKPYVEPLAQEVNLDDLLGSCLVLLWREIHNLKIASSGGTKLSKEQAADLRENTRLLMELKKKEKELLDTLTDEELQELVNDGNKSGGAKKSNRPTRKAKKATEGV